ncbi:splicing regulator RBM11 [Protobothrops mucrosquamatus]|uniref:splicing regulator RBM11 n=1 Tax=Protobothrops mucrosquamatus TaxID=103944 RepID=UPI0007759C3D|nr:splicing regulator RBM11 [Protobothrops mucrosquamatus]
MSMTTQNRADEPDRTLFVGNLESRVKEEILYELFLQAGPVSKVTVCKDKDGNPKSFGFVCFKHTESVPYAMALLNGIRLYGRPIKVQYRFGSTHCLELSSPSQNMDGEVQASTYRYAESYCDTPLPVSPCQVNNNPHQIYSAIQSMMTCLTQQYVPYIPVEQPFLYPQMTSSQFPSIPVSSYMNTGQDSFESVYSEAKTHSQYLITKNTPKRKRTLEVRDDGSNENSRKKCRKK